MSKIFHQFLFLILLAVPANAQIKKFYKGNNYLKAKLVSDLSAFQPAPEPEKSVGRIGVYLEIEKDWHTYWKDSGEAAIPTKVFWTLPTGWTVGELQWPEPYHFIERGDIHTYGYKDEVLLFADLFAPAIEPNRKENLNFSATVQFLVCNDICVPGEQIVSKEISYSFTEPLEASEDFELFERFSRLVPDLELEEIKKSAPLIDKREVKKTKKTIKFAKKTTSVSFLFALISAFFAGMILNLMPCVLPIISIKVMSFLGNAEKTSKDALKSALAFAFGIIFSFMALAAVVISLKSLGGQLGWGFQFQYPEFVIALTIIIFVFALGFFEVYTFNVNTGTASRKVDALKHPFAKNFFEGILATALATPCTAPFLGTALAFAFTQDTFSLIAIFLSISLGLATPYVYLASHPKVIAKLPTPGEWMNSFKKLMGFFLLATVVWLLFVLNRLTEIGSIYALIVLLIISFAFFINEASKNRSEDFKRVLPMILFAIVALSVTYFWSELTEKKSSQTKSPQTELINWQSYDEELVNQATSKKRAVFIDFTADWCITCKANENLIIETVDVASAFNKNNVLAIKADWTAGDEKITEALKRYGGNGVPHYVFIGRDGEVEVLPTILTKNILIERMM